MIRAFVTLFNILASHSLQRFILCSSFFVCIISFSFCNSSAKKKETRVIPDNDSVQFINLPASTPLSNNEKNRIKYQCQLWYDSVLKSTGFNGGMLVAKHGTVIFEQYNGNGHIGGTDAITDTTPFHIASVSKTFTAMAILKLWQDGKLNIDDELVKYFPTFNYNGVTIRSLLNHRSGLPNYIYFMEDLGWDKAKFIKNQNVLDYLINHKADLKNISPPNSHFAYCNTNYILLALLIEKVSGNTYPDFIKKEFFEPLQMTHSFIFSLQDSNTVTPSYDWRGREIPLNFLDQVYGDKNIYSTPKDLLTWHRVLSSNLLFNQQTLDQAYAPYSNEKPGIRNYGLGWRMNIYSSGKKMIYHNGWWHGNNAVLLRLLEEDAVIIVLGNKYNRGIYKAKNLANVFSNYFENDTEDETENQKTNVVQDSTSSNVILEKPIAKVKKRKKRR